MPKIPMLQEFLVEVGFTQGPVMILTDILFKPEHWHNKEGPFKKEWRNTVRYRDHAVVQCDQIQCSYVLDH